MGYTPERYWNDVAVRISGRNQSKTLAGDDDPYYQYKRRKFLSLLKKIIFFKKKVLELGPGPGGNLLEVYKLRPGELHGVDISEEMIQIADEVIKDTTIQLQKGDGKKIPYPDNYFDLCYTATVLQHITNESMLGNTIREMCRVTKKDIYLFEKIEKKIKGTELCLGRPVKYYQSLFQMEGFNLRGTEFLNIQISYWVCGVIRKTFNSKKRKEAEKESTISNFFQKMILPVTIKLDMIFKKKRELAMLHFSKT
jgi:ubiquinone/menaquinone biosynthesis C-methylase UbiE